MGGNIVIKISKDKDPNEIARKVRDILSQAGYNNINFSFKKQSQSALDNNAQLQMLLTNS